MKYLLWHFVIFNAVIQLVFNQHISVNVVCPIPTRDFGLLHYTEHMVKFIQLVHN